MLASNSLGTTLLATLAMIDGTSVFLAGMALFAVIFLLVVLVVVGIFPHVGKQV